MNVNTAISLFNKCSEETVNFFSALSKENETAQPKENAFKKLPIELIETIFTFVPVQTRLSDLPFVCHHFFSLTRPFSKKCFELSNTKVRNKIIKEKGLLFDDGKYLHILNFKEPQELFLYTSRFDISSDSEKECTELFQSAIQSYINILHQDDKFDISSFIKKSNFADKHSWTGQKIISNSCPHIGRRMEIQEIECLKVVMTFLCNLDDQKLEIISEILSNFRSNDLIKLKNELLFLFEKEERENVINALTGGQGYLLELLLRHAILENKNFELFFKYNIFDFIILTPEKCFEKLKAIIKELSKKCDFIFDHKNSLFFIDQKVKGLVFSSYQTELIYPAKVAPEYQWLANRFINK